MPDRDDGILIRPIEPGDCDAWVALRHALWPDAAVAELAQDARTFFASAEKRVGVMPEAVFVAEDRTGPGTRLVGFAEISRRLYSEGCSTSPVGFLEGWFVTPEWRRRGVGARLVRAGETWAQSLGCTEFASNALVDNDLSTAAHRALGFDEVEVVRYFRKDLTP